MSDDKLQDEEGRLAALRRYDSPGSGVREPFERIVDLVREVIGVPMAAVTLIDRDTQWLKAERGLDTSSTLRRDAFCNYTIQQMTPLAVSDATLDGRFAGNPLVLGQPHIRSYLGVPLTTSDGYNIGSLCAIDNEPRPFDARQGSIMQKLAQIVVEQFELQQIAKQDSMTGALTRRGFIAELDREFLRATRYDRPSALVVIDVDHFKSINDHHGHPVGDAVLISIANTCIATMRKSDVFGRLGGEEFTLLLPETEVEDARQAAERIRRLIEMTIVEVAGLSIRATVSMGVAALPPVAEGVAAWLAEADAALYEAKNAGRNRVVVSKPRRPAPLATDPAHQLARPH